MPALFKVDNSLNKSEEIADLLLFMVNEDGFQVPKLPLFQLLAAKARPGLNPDIMASDMVARFKEIGIPTGALKEGTPNVMENYTKVLMETITDHIQNNMRVDIAVDQGINGVGTGANGGGPISTFVTTIKPHTGIGVAR